VNRRQSDAKTWLIAVSASLALHLVGVAGFGTWARGRAPALMPQIRSALRPVRVALAEPVPVPPLAEVSPRTSPRARSTASATRARPVSPQAAKGRQPTAKPRGIAAAPAPPPAPLPKVLLPPEAMRPIYSRDSVTPDAELVRPSLPAEYVLEAPDAAPSPSVFDFGAGPGDPATGVVGGTPGGVPGGIPGGIPGGVPGGIPGGMVGGSTDGTPDGSPAEGSGNGDGHAAAPAPPPMPLTKQPDPPPTITPAKAIATPACSYPRGAIREGHSGSVRLRIRIRRDGRVGDAQVIKSAGDRRLDEAAAKVVREEWLFSPARQGDVPIEATCVATVRFILD